MKNRICGNCKHWHRDGELNYGTCVVLPSHTPFPHWKDKPSLEECSPVFGGDGAAERCKCFELFEKSSSTLLKEPPSLREIVELVNSLKDSVKTMQTSSLPTYYCDSCFHIHGRIIDMTVEIDDKDEDGIESHLACSECLGGWKINQGLARHIVSLKLQQYRDLAKQLGMDLLDGVPTEREE